MYGVCCIPFLFLKKTARQKYIFQILSQKNAQIRNLKNPDLDLIRIIHPECEFYGFMIRFRIRKPGFGFFPKTRTLICYTRWIIIHLKYLAVSDWLQSSG